MKKILTILLFATFVVWTYGQTSKLSPYTFYFIEARNAATNDSISAIKLKKQFGVKKISEQQYVSCFIQIEDQSVLSELESHGVLVNTVLTSIITAQVPINEIENIAALKNVKKIEVGTPVRKRMDKAREVTKVDSVHRGVNLTGPFKGSGVVVGIVDGGFEYGHINFYDSTGTNFRVKRVWDQNTTETSPSGFNYGAEYATTTDILNAEYDYEDTHGTHVTGIAAGAYYGNNYHGVASESDIVLVSYKDSTDNSSILDGVNYIYKYAGSVNKPAVVNMSLGYHIGPHDGTSTFDQACDELQGRGRLLVGAAGNEGGDGLHISKTFAANDTLKTFFSLYSNSVRYGYADIWGEENKSLKVQVVIYKGSTNEILYSTDFINAATTNNKSYSLSSNSSQGARGTISIVTEKNSQNNKPNAFVYFYMSSITSGNYIGLKIVSEDGATVHAWADDSYSSFTSNNIPGWTDGNSNYSVGEIGGSGKRIISVGAYTSKNRFTTLYAGTQGSNAEVGDITYFSSIGPTVDGRVKPDITAPGSYVISSYSNKVANRYSDYYGYITNRETVNGKSYYFGAMQGTSMATPLVTGILATWLGVDPELTPESVRTILKQTAIQDSYTSTIPTEGSNTWGYGKIDAWAGIKRVMDLLTDVGDINVDANLLIYPNPLSISTNEISMLFQYDDTNVAVQLFSLDGKMLMNQPVGTINYREKVYINNISSLTTGMYLLYIKGDNKSFGHKIIVK